MNNPGELVEIDDEIEEELRKLIKKDQLSFFGGHPKSLEKSELKLIFEVRQDPRGVLPCDFNVC